jgi:hypothetical protein
MPRLVTSRDIRYKFLRKNLAVLKALTDREWEYIIEKFPRDINDVPQAQRSKQLSYLRPRFEDTIKATQPYDEGVDLMLNNLERYELADYTDLLCRAIKSFTEIKALLNNDLAGILVARSELQRRLDVIAANS